MKKLIITTLAAAFALIASQQASAKGWVKQNYDSARARGQSWNDLQPAPATNDNQVIQVDFKYPTANLPATAQTHIALISRCATSFPSSFSGGGNGNTIAGIPASFPYVMLEIFNNVTSNTGNAPLRLLIRLSDGGAKIDLAQGLCVSADGLTSVNYDHNWHRLVFSVLGLGTIASPATISASIDGTTYLTYGPSTSLAVPTGGAITLLTENVNSEPGGNVLNNNVKHDNLRVAYTVAGLVNAPVINDDFDSYTLGAASNGAATAFYGTGADNAATSPTTTVDNYVIAASFGASQPSEESNYFNASAALPAPGRGCIFLNQTAAGQNYNIVALDDTSFSNDATDIISDIKYPSALSAAQANSLGVTAFITERLVGGIGAHNAANNDPGVEFSVSVTAGGFLKFDIVQRTGTNVSNTAGASLGTFTSALGFDHSWHRLECRINATNIPAILWDGNVVLTGTTAGAGRAGTLATGFFVGGTNAGPVPITTPATLSALATPNVVSAANAPDEFFAIGQYMTGATTAAQNIRWDNIRAGNPATPNTTNSIYDNISSYGVNSQVGTVANNTALRNSATLADPWYTVAGAGGSNPAQWAIDTTDNSTIGVSGLNAVSDFFVY